MLKLSMKPGDYLDIGENIRVVFTGGSANNIHLMIDAPREVNIARSSAGGNHRPSGYHKDRELSEQAKREIADVLMRERYRQSCENR